jgi:hypothetical protein
MAAKRKTTRNPDATVHRQVKPGEVVTYQRHTYADRCTLQVPSRDVDALLATGKMDELKSDADVPDVAA